MLADKKASIEVLHNSTQKKICAAEVTTINGPKKDLETQPPQFGHIHKIQYHKLFRKHFMPPRDAEADSREPLVQLNSQSFSNSPLAVHRSDNQARSLAMPGERPSSRHNDRFESPSEFFTSPALAWIQQQKLLHETPIRIEDSLLPPPLKMTAHVPPSNALPTIVTTEASFDSPTGHNLTKRYESDEHDIFAKSEEHYQEDNQEMSALEYGEMLESTPHFLRIPEAGPITFASPSMATSIVDPSSLPASMQKYMADNGVHTQPRHGGQRSRRSMSRHPHEQHEYHTQDNKRERIHQFRSRIEEIASRSSTVPSLDAVFRARYLKLLHGLPDDDYSETSSSIKEESKQMVEKPANDPSEESKKMEKQREWVEARYCMWAEHKAKQHTKATTTSKAQR
eukprot:GILJ01006304.1.p1 GENE.GILJ01006304.1~~GILJ01006304.1.p1  ORF type:complete len:397 (-),score=58.32 GILJ01006304.1:150-1340(-)